MFPVCLSGLMEWTKSPNRWMRRAAAVSLIVLARKIKIPGNGKIEFSLY